MGLQCETTTTRPATHRARGRRLDRALGEREWWWGYTRIEGALANLGHRVSRTTVANILKRHGIDPAPERGKRIPWSQFLKSHWEVIAAMDFFTVEGISRMIFFGEQSLRRAISRFAEHHHAERNHQGLDDALIEPEDGVGECRGDIECRERLGGMLRYYFRAAA